jgi:hypothetical protein
MMSLKWRSQLSVTCGMVGLTARQGVNMTVIARIVFRGAVCPPESGRVGFRPPTLPANSDANDAIQLVEA